MESGDIWVCLKEVELPNLGNRIGLKITLRFTARLTGDKRILL